MNVNQLVTALKQENIKVIVTDKRLGRVWLVVEPDLELFVTIDGESFALCQWTGKGSIDDREILFTAPTNHFGSLVTEIRKVTQS